MISLRFYRAVLLQLAVLPVAAMAQPTPPTPPSPFGSSMPAAPPAIPGASRVFGEAVRVQPSAPPSATPSVAAGAMKVELSDRNLRRTLDRWSRAEGRQLIWEFDRDVEILAEASFGGGYEPAIEQLMATFARSESPLRACLYSNSVTRIVTRSVRCD